MPRPESPNRTYAASLALVAILILVVGWLIRPPDEALAPATALSETELARLARLAERRSLDNMTAYFSTVADDVESSVLLVRSAGTTGLVWDDFTIAAPHRGHHPPDVVMIDAASGDHESHTEAWVPDVPVTIVGRPDTAVELTPVRRRLAPLRSGDWIVAVWRTPRGPAFAIGHHLQTLSTTCGTVVADEMLSSLPLADAMIGGGLFDAAGEIVGVILPCGDRLAAVAPPAVDAMLALAASLPARLAGRVGLAAGPMDGSEADHFGGARGLLVREIWMGSAADRAGLRPGDMILSVGDAPVAALEDLAPLADAERPTLALGIRRGAAAMMIDVPASGASADAPAVAPPSAGLVWDTPARGFRIDGVVPGSPAADAGIAGGDRLVRIDGAAPRTLAQVERLLAAKSRSPTVFVEIERGGRRIGMLLR